jgi:hypothetical protein
VAAGIVLLGLLTCLGILQARWHARATEVRTALAGLTPERIERWQESAPYLKPLAELVNSLSPAQMRRIARSKHYRLPYLALSPSQQRLFDEALTIKWRSTPPLTVPREIRSRGWQGAGMRPAFLYVMPPPSSRRRSFVASLAVTYVGPHIRGEAGGTVEVPR